MTHFCFFIFCKMGMISSFFFLHKKNRRQAMNHTIKHPPLSSKAETNVAFFCRNFEGKFLKIQKLFYRCLRSKLYCILQLFFKKFTIFNNKRKNPGVSRKFTIYSRIRDQVQNWWSQFRFHRVHVSQGCQRFHVNG